MIAEIIAQLLGGAIGGDLYERHRRRRLARDHAAGRPLEFPGSVLGVARYCHPPGGMLRVDRASLEWLTGHGGKSYAVPVERLHVQDLADVRMSEAIFGGRTVAVVCDDGSTGVRIVILRSDLPYLALAMPGLQPWLTTPAP